jgi:hypothetical protein
VFVGVALWIAVVTIWAFGPMSANVHTGVAADGKETTATVQCDSPLSGNSSPTQALPTLGAGQSIGDPPCESPVNSGRAVYIFDVIVAVGIVFVVIAVGRRSNRRARAQTTDAHEVSASV